jgi:serine phosphatase RsbU (regulator of sigma subunit)
VEHRRFAPGDTLLAYTDGALECRNSLGRMLGVAGLKRVLVEAHRPKPDSACALAGAVIAAVEGHRAGPAEDDTLVVEVKRQVSPEAARDANGTEARRTPQPVAAP